MLTDAAANFHHTPVEQACVDYPLSPDLCTDGIEQRIIRAYVRLVIQAENTDDSRPVVMRLEPVQVHLTEMLPKDTIACLPLFWIKVFDGTGQVSIDSI